MKQKIFWIIIFNIIIVISEIVFGIASKSLALIADALHNAGDTIAIVITYIAIRLSDIKASFKYTFGFLKAEMMAGFVNMLFLFITMFYIIYEAVDRFFNIQTVEPIYMIVVGLIAFVANGVSAYFLNNLGVSNCPNHQHDHNHNSQSVNIQSAYLHMLADALISIAVVIAGVFIYYFNIYYIDSILTILFSVYILLHSYPLLKKSFLSLMDANISAISLEKLDKIIKCDKRIVEYHDLHISKPDSQNTFISFHVVLNDANLTLSKCEALTHKIRQKLQENDFNHVLIQTDTKQHLKSHTYCHIQ